MFSVLLCTSTRQSVEILRWSDAKIQRVFGEPCGAPFLRDSADADASVHGAPRRRMEGVETAEQVRSLPSMLAPTARRLLTHPFDLLATGGRGRPHRCPSWCWHTQQLERHPRLTLGAPPLYHMRPPAGGSPTPKSVEGPKVRLLASTSRARIAAFSRANPRASRLIPAHVPTTRAQD